MPLEKARSPPLTLAAHLKLSGKYPGRFRCTYFEFWFVKALINNDKDYVANLISNTRSDFTVAITVCRAGGCDYLLINSLWGLRYLESFVICVLILGITCLLQVHSLWHSIFQWANVEFQLPDSSGDLAVTIFQRTFLIQRYSIY